MSSANARMALAAMLGTIAAVHPGGIQMLFPDTATPERFNRRERIAANYARRACEGLGGIPKGRP